MYRNQCIINFCCLFHAAFRILETKVNRLKYNQKNKKKTEAEEEKTIIYDDM